MTLENVQTITGERSSRSGGARGNHDPMISVVVEPRREEFQALNDASGHVAPADFLRLVALRLAALNGRTPQ
jgi:hypothetical protein